MFEFSVAALSLLLYFQCNDVNASNSSSSGSGTRISAVRIEDIGNGSQVEIGVQVASASDGDNGKSNDHSECPPGQYLSEHRQPRNRRNRYYGLKQRKGLRSRPHLQTRRGSKCTPCSVCTADEVVISQCSATQDTQCGVCLGTGSNRTCHTKILQLTSTDKTLLNPPNSLTSLSQPGNHLRHAGVQERVTNVAESEGESSDFIGALITAALSLVMFLILMITAPLVIYLKCRDWRRYGRPPQNPGNYDKA